MNRALLLAVCLWPLSLAADPIAAPTTPVGAPVALAPPLPAGTIVASTPVAEVTPPAQPVVASEVMTTTTAAAMVMTHAEMVASHAPVPAPDMPAAPAQLAAAETSPTPVVEASPVPASVDVPPAVIAMPPVPDQPARKAVAIDPDWRPIDPENTVIMDTTKGRVILELYPEVAPKHVAQIKTLVKSGFYNNLQFFRVIDWFMAQGGDAQNTGNGSSDLPNLNAEFTFRRAPDMAYARAATQGGVEVGFLKALPITTQPDVMFTRSGDGKAGAWANHCNGVAGMGRDDNPNSANAQYYIMRQPYLSLDKRYTVWGRALVGLDVVRAFAVGEPPAQPDMTAQVRMAADVPDPGKVEVMRTDGPRFARLVSDMRKKKGADFHVCDLTIPVRTQ